ncbi:hypothetical protein BJF78_26810 [Pseudonocardia sp. CNS-139]|nr:hypothetical protein BJF78_26810 [Pseudonocardia sp. CNS-139]
MTDEPDGDKDAADTPPPEPAEVTPPSPEPQLVFRPPPEPPRTQGQLSDVARFMLGDRGPGRVAEQIQAMKLDDPPDEVVMAVAREVLWVARSGVAEKTPDREILSEILERRLGAVWWNNRGTKKEQTESSKVALAALTVAVLALARDLAVDGIWPKEDEEVRTVADRPAQEAPHRPTQEAPRPRPATEQGNQAVVGHPLPLPQADIG